MATAGADRIVSRLFLKEAGLECAGRRRDEQLIHEIAIVIVGSFGKTPFVKGKKRQNESQALSSLRASPGGDIWSCGGLSAARWALRDEALAEEVQPRHLDRGIENSLRHCFARGPDGKVQRDMHGRKVLLPLGYHTESKRQAAKDTAASVVRHHLQKWLQSADGDAWRREREELLGQGSASAAG